MIAVDTNLLVYAHRAGCAEHEEAQKAIERAAAGRDGWCFAAGTCFPVHRGTRRQWCSPRVFDLQIGLLCLEAGVTELWTRDAGFVVFPGLKIFDPLAPRPS